MNEEFKRLYQKNQSSPRTRWKDPEFLRLYNLYKRTRRALQIYRAGRRRRRGSKSILIGLPITAKRDG